MRILCLIILASFISAGGVGDLVVAAAALMLLYIVLGGDHAYSAWRMLRRMRWFFLSIAVIYFWFTPGDVLFPQVPSSLASLVPTQEGLWLGLVRIAVLILIVAAVNLLLRTTAREQLLQAIYWLAWPLTWMGVSRDRIAVRITLALEAVPKVQALLGERRSQWEGEGRGLRKLGEIAADLYQQVVVRAHQEPVQVIEVHEGLHPPFYQWFYPLILATVFWVI